MARLDPQALQDSKKALNIIFIITICVSSLCLIVKLLRQPAYTLSTIRHLTILSLTCGTLLFSIFPLVVKARLLFENVEYFSTVPVSCKTRRFSSVYESFFFPFVYGIGLIVLGLELYLEKRGSRSPPHILMRFVYVLFPWLLGVVLVLPLTLAGIKWDYACYSDFSLDRYRAHIWVCSILPAIAVLLFAIFLAFKVGGSSTTNSSVYAPTMVSSSSTQRVVQSSSSSSSHGFAPHASYNATSPPGVVLSQRPESVHFHQSPYDYQSAPPSYQTLNLQHQHHQDYPNSIDKTMKQPMQQHQQQLPQPPAPPGQYPTAPPHYTLPPNYAPPPPGFGPPYYEYDHHTSTITPHHHHSMPHSHSQPQIINGSNAAATATGSSAANSAIRDCRNEAKIFTGVAAIYVFLSLPYGIYHLAYLMNEDRDRVTMDNFTQVVLTDTIYWLTVLRWLVLCIIWFLAIK